MNTDQLTGYLESQIQVVHPPIRHPEQDLLPLRYRGLCPLNETTIADYDPEPLFLVNGKETPNDFHRILMERQIADKDLARQTMFHHRNNILDYDNLPRFLDGMDLDVCVRRSLLEAENSYGYQVTTVEDILHDYEYV